MNNNNSLVSLNTPDKDLHEVAQLLHQMNKQQMKEKGCASAKIVLILLCMGGAIGLTLLAPKAAGNLGKTLFHNIPGFDDWKKKNKGYLKQTLKRLEQQKLIEWSDEGGKQIIKISERGRTKILTYALRELTLTKPLRWDGKWRIVIYDIPKKQKRLEEILHRVIKRLGFYPIQESVYLTPYPCFKEVEFLRQYYGLGPYIKYLLVTQLEDDTAYKTYFGL